MGNYPGRRRGTRRIIIWTSGKPREWTIRGTKADGDQFEARKRIELGEVAAGPRSAVGFSTLCREYSVHAQTHLKSSTWKVRRYVLASLIEFFGETRVDRLSLPKVEAYKLHRLDSVGAVAVNNELRALSAVMTYGRSVGYPIPRVNWRALPERGHGRVKTWSLTELGRIFDAAAVTAPTLVPMLVWLANTGCRKGEAVAAEWSWVDMNAGIIRIPATEYWQPKSGKPREIPISDALAKVLRGKRRSDRWVFPNRSGRRFKAFPFLVWQKVLKHAKVSGNPHMFRHTFASMLLARVPDMFLLAQLLGHSTTRVTELYSHLLPGHLEKARNAVSIGPTTGGPRVGGRTRKPKSL
jgi:integrase